MAEGKLRLDELTIMRAIACLSVLMVHISAIPFDEMLGSEWTLTFFAYFNRAFKYTTPAFIFLSGLMQYYHNSEGVFNFKKFMKKRFGPIFWPYLTAVLLYETVFLLVGAKGFDLKGGLVRLLLGTSNYHLYFVVIIMQLYLLMPLILKAFEHFDDKLVLFGSLVVNLWAREFLIMPYSDRIFINYLFFFVLGAYVVRHMDWFKEKLSKHLWALTVVYVSMAAIYGRQFVGYTLKSQVYDAHLTSLTWFLFSTVAICFLYGLSVHILEIPYRGLFKKWVGTVNTASYWIYLIHPLVLYVSVGLWRASGFRSTTMEFVWNFAIVVGSMLIFAWHYPNLKQRWQKVQKAILAFCE